MKSCLVYILVALFSLLAIPQASAQSIVGAWTAAGQDTTAEGAAVVVFFANGYYIHIQNASKAEAPSGFDGYELGSYTWDQATGALAVEVIQDHNGDIGLGDLSGLSGITFHVSGDTGTLNVPGGDSLSASRVTGASPIVGAWGNASGTDNSSIALVFLPNGVYFEAEDGKADADGQPGIEHGTYSWNPTTGVLTTSQTPAPYVDTNGRWGGSNLGPNTFKVSADGLTLTIFVDGEIGVIARVGAASTPAAANYQGLWWKADESGWGVNFVHQGDRVFATWYTYDTSGNAYWLSMLADRQPTGNAYKGDVYVDVGPPFNNFVGSGMPTKVGDGTVTFTDANNGSFFYEVTAGGATSVVQQTKTITRFSLGGPQPVCTYASAPNLAAATNYQDLWWVPTESGWGVNFAHQGNLLFATWYTYDAKVAGNNAPLWLSALLSLQPGTTNVYLGTITRTSGPRFDNYVAPPATQVVGSLNVTFTDGNHATFTYVIPPGVANLPPVPSQTKSITRFLFAGPAGTVCQ